MIPVQIDVVGIVAELRARGWTDYKLEIATGLGQGYIAQCRMGNVKNPSYGKAARLYNFWVQEMTAPSTAFVSMSRLVNPQRAHHLEATLRST